MSVFRKSTEVNASSAFKTTTLFGQAIGAISLFLGFGFFLLGLTGTLDLIIESKSISARLANGSPGVVFIIVGFLILWRYKPKESTTTSEEHVVEHYPSNDSAAAREKLYRIEEAAIDFIDTLDSDELRRIRLKFNEADNGLITYLIQNPTRLEPARARLARKVDAPITSERPLPVAIERYQKKSSSDRAMLTPTRRR